MPLFQGHLDQDAEPVKNILSAAERCLWRSGYGGMSIRDVAEEAGVSKSLLHYHFRSKEHLLLEVQVGVYNRLAAHVTDAVRSAEPGSERGLLAFDALVESLRSVPELPVLAELQTRALSNPKLRTHALRMREYLCNLIEEMFASILGPEMERFPMPPRVAADLLLGLLVGVGLQSGLDEDRERTDATLGGFRVLVALALGELNKE